jgi:hypothetical protein
MLIGRTHLHEPVSYWTWLNSDIVAIVTDTAVFHWDLWQGEGDALELDELNEMPRIWICLLIDHLFNSFAAEDRDRVPLV